VVVSEHLPPEMPSQAARQRGIKRLRKQLVGKIIAHAKGQEKARQNLKSLVFGLATGCIVILVSLFGLFNEMVLAPFIQPGNSTGNAPIILASDSIAPTSVPEVIIPKINVEIPVVYNIGSVEESAIQTALERGVIHYDSTSVPGQKGNVAIFGHSSNNIFNKGAYKFAFVKLRTLEPGDVFHLTYNGKVYSYKTYAKRVVDPTETTVLNPVLDKVATATLITCDPPGTSSKRLVVWGEQISPDPAGASEAQVAGQTAPTQLSSNGPTLFSRIWRAIF
jgi:sortase A